ncbi:MAG: DNA-3-methyladenine glycosylase I [Rhodobacteraceae bacterium]|nr:DNA-3-methyladenine glycosylase I [Paracoccaceae bacterium]
MPRCAWAGPEEIYRLYHDTEWGVPDRDSRGLFEKLTLEGFQAGLSWITILRKRDGFRRAFAGFDPDVIAGWGEVEVARLLGDPGIVRHRGKIEATIGNARAWQEIEAQEGFAQFVWGHVGGRAVQGAWQTEADVPGATALSARMSRDLKARGFRFCGPTTVYAFMQAAGLVNDHVAGCPRHADVARLAGAPLSKGAR